MAGSVNKVILIGNLGKDPEVRSMPSGDEMVSFSIATSESWNDKASGEKKERTNWHNIVIFNPNLVKVAKSYLKKGSKVFIEGALETRSWDNKDGVKQYTTEVVLRQYRGELTMLDGKSGGGANDQGGYNTDAPYAGAYGGSSANTKPASKIDDLEDDIPF
jgi:single-strand DNA-binding protein